MTVVLLLQVLGFFWGRVGLVTEDAVTLQKVPGHTASIRSTAQLSLHNDTEIYLSHQLLLVSGTSLR